MNITVYLSSKADIDEEYNEAVKQLGRGIGELKSRLIYGGSNAGQMHTLAVEAKAAGATVTGIIPEVFRQLADPAADEMVYTLDLNERKSKMMVLGHIFVAMPGGIGTLDEVMSTLADMTVTRNFKKKIILVNIKGLFNPFIQQLNEFLKQNFASKEAIETIIPVNSVDECLEILKKNI